MICPKCGEKENLHYNYDYDGNRSVILDVLCNECGEIFKPTKKNAWIRVDDIHGWIDGPAIKPHGCQTVSKDRLREYINRKGTEIEIIKGYCKDCSFCDIKETFHNGDINLCHKPNMPRRLLIAVKSEEYCSDWKSKI